MTTLPSFLQRRVWTVDRDLEDENSAKGSTRKEVVGANRRLLALALRVARPAVTGVVRPLVRSEVGTPCESTQKGDAYRRLEVLATTRSTSALPTVRIVLAPT
jgi:hypothetical protein